MRFLIIFFIFFIFNNNTFSKTLFDVNFHEIQFTSNNIDEDKLNQLKNEMLNRVTTHKEIFIIGNGGSAAHSQHFAAELVCTYKNRNRKPYRAIALTTDTSIITAWSNDRDFASIFTRQIEAFEGITGLTIGLGEKL